MNCEKCASPLAEGNSYCEKCGASASTTQQESPAAQATEPPVMSPPPINSQPAYAPYSYAPYSNTMQQGAEPLSVGQYIGMFLLLIIPIVNLVLLFVWGFGSGVNPNKRNFARAYLIIMAIGTVLSFVFIGAILSILSELTGGLY